MARGGQLQRDSVDKWSLLGPVVRCIKSVLRTVTPLPGASPGSLCLVSYIYDVLIIKCPPSSQRADHRGAISSEINETGRCNIASLVGFG